MRDIIFKARARDFEGAISLIVAMLEKQNKELAMQKRVLKELDARVAKLARKTELTQQLVVDPLLEEIHEERSLSEMLAENFKTN